MTDAVELNRLRDQVGELHDDLHRLAERDPDQEVWWRAKPVIEAAIEAAEKWVGEDAVAKMRAMLLPGEEEDLGPVPAADLVPTLGHSQSHSSSETGHSVGGEAAPGFVLQGT